MTSHALTFSDVDVFAGENKLAVRTCFVIKPGTELVIHAFDEKFFVEVVDVSPADDNDIRHDYYVTVKCDKMEELRKAFTYEVEARA